LGPGAGAGETTERETNEKKRHMWCWHFPRAGFTGAELAISWSTQSQELDVNGQKVRLSPKNGRVVLHILLDIPSVEVVSGGGESYSLKGRDYRKLGEESPMEIRVDGGDVKFSRLEFYPLKSTHSDSQ
jgi:hypothetical protein